MEQNNEIILYQPDSSVTLEVRVEDETVWLTQAQIADLFGVKQPAISKHLSNIYKSGELEENSTYSILEYLGNDGKQVYKTKYYNLDVILSIGYRVNSKNATLFRQWANKVLKEYLLKGYSINQRLLDLENRIDDKLMRHERKIDDLSNRVDFVISSSIKPKEVVIFEGQTYDAYVLISDLIQTAKKRIAVIDNFADHIILTQLIKRNPEDKRDLWLKDILKLIGIDYSFYRAKYREGVGDLSSEANQEFAEELKEIF
ncbi:MAG: virulence RhuM family protein [Muribaculaceae bacterium]|nr:virulence RhuM family protein [Muribaculaceae bacterium]